MQIPINIPDNQASRVVDAICANHGYTEESGTKAQFAKNWLINVLKSEVVQAEAPPAEMAVRKTVYDDVRTIDIT